MSPARTAQRLLRLYPRSWRERYGEELADVILHSSDDRVPWRVRLDVVTAGAREQARAAGLGGGGSPRERARGGVLTVLCAWALFVIAGLAVQRTSEHWQQVAAAGDRGLPQAAFVVLIGGAVCAAVLVLAGIAAALPGWRGVDADAVRRAIGPAVTMTVVAVAATVALVVWAHGLSATQRDGHDVAYAIAFVAWALLCAGTLSAWTAAAVSLARRLELDAATLRAQTWLAVAASVAMATITTATVVWWAAVGGKVTSVTLVLAAIAMVLATTLAAAGSRSAVRALPALD
jgi:hypothetical protein